MSLRKNKSLLLFPKTKSNTVCAIHCNPNIIAKPKMLVAYSKCRIVQNTIQSDSHQLENGECLPMLISRMCLSPRAVKSSCKHFITNLQKTTSIGPFDKCAITPRITSFSRFSLFKNPVLAKYLK